jgi:hypothetical protein
MLRRSARARYHEPDTNFRYDANIPQLSGTL